MDNYTTRHPFNDLFPGQPG